jgi:hypothetical protein
VGTLDRYKKKGGFLQLLHLLENSTPTKKDQLLEIIAQESLIWKVTLLKKLITFERVLSWGPPLFAEVVAKLAPDVVAISLKQLPEPEISKQLSYLSKAEQTKIRIQLDLVKPTPGEIITCHHKVVAEVRRLLSEGILTFNQIDPELYIPDKIEEKLALLPDVKAPKTDE